MKEIYIVIRYDNLSSYIEGTGKVKDILGIYTDKKKAEERQRYCVTAATGIITATLNKDCSVKL